MKIAFVTHRKHQEIEDDDRPLAAALARRGGVVLSASWDDPDFAWDRLDIALIRSTWDYHLRIGEFRDWLTRVEGQTRVVNPPGILRWNLNKRYLTELTNKGIRVVPTAFVGIGEAASLENICRDHGWETVVLKPAISADSWETIRIEPDRHPEGQAYLERHRAAREIMIQPFVKDVEQGGEHSLMFFGGAYSHAVRKNSAFQGGRHVGPEGLPADPGKDAVDMAEVVLAAAGVPEIPYARVDIARDDGGRPMLLELELFEPTLFFQEMPGSEEALARLLMK